MKAVVFDLDGVILRNKRLLKGVGNNCTKFVQMYSKHPIDTYAAYQKNAKYYMTYGHSLKGILAENHIVDDDHDAVARLVKAFNDIVYNYETLNDLHEFLHSHEFEDTTRIFGEICDICNVPVHILSNSPFKWCDPVVDRLQRLYGTRCTIDTIYSSSHRLLSTNTQQLFKPDMEVYDRVAADVLGATDTDTDVLGTTPSLCFIDDSLTNVRPLKNAHIWQPILYNEEMKKCDKDISSVTSMQDLKQAIASLLL